MTARRSGDAWRVVIGGTGTMQRVSAIRDLTVGPVQLHAAIAPPSVPARSLCHIGYQPLAGRQEITQNAITTTRTPARTSTTKGSSPTRLTLASSATRRASRDRPRIVHDQAADALALQALDRRIQLDTLFPPTCATASCYYQQRWPMTATLILASNNCPGPRVFVLCDKLRPAWRNTIARVLKPARGRSAEFTVPANLFHPAETMKQINKWWLVIDGGDSPIQPQLLLSHLTTNVAPRFD